MTKPARNKNEMRDQCGMPPVPYDGLNTNHLVADNDGITFARPGPGSVGKRAGAVRGFNLKGVVEVLTEFGLDPVAHIATALQKMKPVYERNDNGNLVPVKNPDGTPKMEPALDEQTRVKVLMELTNFVHPKLKAVEMTMKKPELTDAQIDQRLAALMARAAKKALD